MQILRILTLGILIYTSQSGVIAEESTICRSEIEEIKIKEIAKGAVEILAVCPKKGLFFVELVGEKDKEELFKEHLRKSDIKVVVIRDYKITENSKVFLVEFEY